VSKGNNGFMWPMRLRNTGKPNFKGGEKGFKRKVDTIGGKSVRHGVKRGKGRGNQQKGPLPSEIYEKHGYKKKTTGKETLRAGRGRRQGHLTK